MDDVLRTLLPHKKVKVKKVTPLNNLM